MDSVEDATTQLNEYRRGFCELPFCLGNTWHGWGCCSSATLSTSSRADSKTDPIDPRRSLENAVEALLSTSGHKQDQKPETVPARAAKFKRYTIPVTDTDVAKARVESVPKKTREDSSYCVKVWQDCMGKQQATNVKC